MESCRNLEFVYSFEDLLDFPLTVSHLVAEESDSLLVKLARLEKIPAQTAANCLYLSLLFLDELPNTKYTKNQRARIRFLLSDHSFRTADISGIIRDEFLSIATLYVPPALEYLRNEIKNPKDLDD